MLSLAAKDLNQLMLQRLSHNDFAVAIFTAIGVAAAAGLSNPLQ